MEIKYILVQQNIRVFLIHHDEERKEKYLARARRIKNEQGELICDLNQNLQITGALTFLKII